MTTIAVVVGVNDYQFQPLTSAVSDALAVRDELVALGLVTPADVRLLTSPVVAGAEFASSRNVEKALHDVYDEGSASDRLFVFLSGHGMLAPADAARATYQTAFMPVDVADLDNDAKLLLNVDDLVERFRFAGPREQFFFVDACRDLAFGENPGNMPALTWKVSKHPAASATAQALLYAVSPLGKARGVVDGLGVMTRHLVDGLRGTGRALDWSDDDGYVVTAQSLADYVRARVLEQTAGVSQREQAYMLPVLETDSSLTPIRVVDPPPTRTITLTFDPPEAAAATDVRLWQRGNRIEEPRWPPTGPGIAVAIAPQPSYTFKISSSLGDAHAVPPRIDAREQDSAVIRLGAPPAPDRSGGGPGPARVDDTWGSPPVFGLVAPRTARVEAIAAEPETVIDIDALEPPYASYRGTGSLNEHVPPGAYRIRFRLGPDVFSEAEFDVAAGDSKVLRPTLEASSLLAETLEVAGSDDVSLLETIGPIQADVVPTMLALIGVKQFDRTREIRGRIEGLVQPLDFDAFERRPLSVLVAVDGSTWPVDPSAVAAAIECEVIPGDDAREAVPLASVRGGEAGWGRIVHGAVVAPGPSFVIRLASPHFGVIELASTSLPERISVAGIVVRPDGTTDVNLNLLRLPGGTYREHVSNIPYGKQVRQLILGQQLFRSGELVTIGTRTLSDLLYAKWTDPLLGCMALYAWLDAMQEPHAPNARGLARVTANNLLKYFGELPDARIAAAHVLADRRQALLDGVLASGAVPVLARSMRALAAEANKQGMDDSPVVSWARRVVLTSPWTVRIDPVSAGTEVEETHGLAVAVQD